MAINTLKDRAEKSTTKLRGRSTGTDPEEFVAERSQIRNRLGEMSLLKNRFQCFCFTSGKNYY